jgi:hypothetical protein
VKIKSAGTGVVVVVYVVLCILADVCKVTAVMLATLVRLVLVDTEATVWDIVVIAVAVELLVLDTIFVWLVTVPTLVGALCVTVEPTEVLDELSVVETLVSMVVDVKETVVILTDWVGIVSKPKKNDKRMNIKMKS